MELVECLGYSTSSMENCENIVGIQRIVQESGPHFATWWRRLGGFEGRRDIETSRPWDLGTP
jgi:hypothetical protein